MKSQLSIVEKRAISSKKLQNRLNLNSKLGSKDLTKWLFDRYKIIRNELVEINYDLNDKKHVINTINSFSDLASEEDSNFMIITPLLFLMTLFLILLFELNKKLNNLPYIKKLS